MTNGKTDSSSEAPKRTTKLTKSRARSRLRKTRADAPSKRPRAALTMRRCRALTQLREPDPALSWCAEDGPRALSGGVIGQAADATAYSSSFFVHPLNPYYDDRSMTSTGSAQARSRATSIHTPRPMSA